MRAFLICFVALVAALAPSFLHADGMILQLPNDGVWAEYKLTISRIREKKVETRLGSARVASVGTETRDGAPCRWIEFLFLEDPESAKSASETTRKEILKVLVPEKFLVKGETPIDHVLEAWRGRNQEKPTKMENYKNLEGGPLSLFLAGPLKDPKPLPKKEFESKLGKKSCEGISGALDLSSTNGRDYHFEVKKWFHSDVPFGLVSEEGTCDNIMPSTQIQWNLTLIDSGENATSEMPKN